MRVIVPLIAVAAGLGAGGAHAETPGTPREGRLSVIFLDVGQGDAILIRCPDGRPGAVIDSGDVPSRVPRAAAALKHGLATYFGDEKSLPVVIATHPHSDHIGNLEGLMREYAVETYVDNGQAPKQASATYLRLEKAVTEKTAHGVSRVTPEPPSPVLQPCADPRARIRLLGPSREWGDCAAEPNNCSVVSRLDFGKTSFLFTGDIEQEAERRYLSRADTRALLDTDVLKAAHHGSQTSSSPEFLSAVSPQVVVISAGRPDEDTNRGYRHPRWPTVQSILSVLPDSLSRPPATLRAFNRDANAWGDIQTTSPLFVTAADGDVIIETDGRSIKLPAGATPGAGRSGGAADGVIRSDCAIKGNINAKGERIYHLPGGMFYAQTKIDPAQGERMFCSEEEAQKAGWRRSRR